MKVEFNTVYNIKDIVYVLYKSRICVGEIYEYDIHIHSSTRIIKYIVHVLSTTTKSVITYQNAMELYGEDKIYKSREELIMAL